MSFRLPWRFLRRLVAVLRTWLGSVRARDRAWIRHQVRRVDDICCTCDAPPPVVAHFSIFAQIPETMIREIRAEIDVPRTRLLAGDSLTALHEFAHRGTRYHAVILDGLPQPRVTFVGLRRADPPTSAAPDPATPGKATT